MGFLQLNVCSVFTRAVNLGPFLGVTTFAFCAGSCFLDFQVGMEREHCSRAGCDTPITTTNYGLVTTPKREWMLVLGLGERANKEELQFGRRIPCCKQLGDLGVAKAALLTPPEIIAVVLYTGPMVSNTHSERANCPFRPASPSAVADIE
jgi:hypothetical protein